MGVALVVVSFWFVFGMCILCVLGVGESGPMGNWHRTISFAVFASLFNIGWASVQVSHMAMVPELTNDDGERVLLNSLRYGWTVGASVYVYVAMLIILKVSPSDLPGQDPTHPYTLLSIAVLALGGVMSLIFLIGTPEKMSPFDHHALQEHEHDAAHGAAHAAVADAEAGKAGTAATAAIADALAGDSRSQSMGAAGAAAAAAFDDNASVAGSVAGSIAGSINAAAMGVGFGSTAAASSSAAPKRNISTASGSGSALMERETECVPMRSGTTPKAAISGAAAAPAAQGGSAGAAFAPRRVHSASDSGAALLAGSGSGAAAATAVADWAPPKKPRKSASASSAAAVPPALGGARKARMTPCDWLRLPVFYQVAAVYMFVRLATNVSAVYLTFFVSSDGPLGMTPTAIAIVPLLVYVSQLVATTLLKRIDRRLGRRNSITLGALCFGAASVAMLFTPASASWAVYPAVLLLGVGSAIAMVVSVSLESDLVGRNVESGAFVYGMISFTDKLSNGGAVLAIQFIGDGIGDKDAHGTFVRYVNCLVPAAAIAAAIVVAWTIKFPKHLRGTAANEAAAAAAEAAAAAAAAGESADEPPRPLLVRLRSFFRSERQLDISVAAGPAGSGGGSKGTAGSEGSTESLLAHEHAPGGSV